jgi:23S rRNA (uracil1939-C5)-methyltransferase
VPDRVEGSGVRSVCGGCHYQHLPYEKQLQAKTDILRDQLQRIGKLENPPVQPIVASPEQWNYRNHVQFHLTDDGKIGFINSVGNSTLPIEECHLPEPTINNFWHDIQFESRMNLERVSLRSGDDDELMLILESETEETPELEIEADVSIVHIYEDHPVVIAGSDNLSIQILGKDFHVSAPSFFQVNTPMAEKMVQHLITNLQLPFTNQPITLLDLYCGVGLFSKFFAPKYAKVIGIESSPSSCEDFAINLDEFDNVELYEGTAEEVLPALASQLTQPIHMIVDPPRAGLDKHALDAILQINRRSLPTSPATHPLLRVTRHDSSKAATPFNRSRPSISSRRPITSSPFPSSRADMLKPLGDSSILIQLGDEIDPTLNQRVHALDALLQTITAITETVPAYCTVLVHYDPLTTTYSNQKSHQ